jgi:hypothetical protein
LWAGLEVTFAAKAAALAGSCVIVVSHKSHGLTFAASDRIKHLQVDHVATTVKNLLVNFALGGYEDHEIFVLHYNNEGWSTGAQIGREGSGDASDFIPWRELVVQVSELVTSEHFELVQLFLDACGSGGMVTGTIARSLMNKPVREALRKFAQEVVGLGPGDPAVDAAKSASSAVLVAPADSNLWGALLALLLSKLDAIAEGLGGDLDWTLDIHRELGLQLERLEKEVNMNFTS